jgi:hypothetical protein
MYLSDYLLNTYDFLDYLDSLKQTKLFERGYGGTKVMVRWGEEILS